MQQGEARGRETPHFWSTRSAQGLRCDLGEPGQGSLRMRAVGTLCVWGSSAQAHGGPVGKRRNLLQVGGVANWKEVFLLPLISLTLYTNCHLDNFHPYPCSWHLGPFRLMSLYSICLPAVNLLGSVDPGRLSDHTC